MAVAKGVNKNGVMEFWFRDIFGGGWESDIYAIIVEQITPEKIERKLYKAGWFSSDSEIVFTKNGCEYIIHLDDADSIYMYSNDKKCNIDFLETCANIIDEGTFKLKHRDQ